MYEFKINCFSYLIAKPRIYKIKYLSYKTPKYGVTLLVRDLLAVLPNAGGTTQQYAASAISHRWNHRRS